MAEKQALVLTTPQRFLTGLAALLVGGKDTDQQALVVNHSQKKRLRGRTEWGASQGSLGGLGTFLLWHRKAGNQQAPIEHKEGQRRTIGTKSTGICWESREWYTAADSLG